MVKKQLAKVNKSAFIRLQPDSLSTKEVVAKARAQGITLTEQNVWATRYAMKNGIGKANKAKPNASEAIVAPKSSVRVVQKISANSGAENQFLSVVLDLGLLRAESLLVEVRRQLKSVLID